MSEGGVGGGHPSSSRPRMAEPVWPEHFVEAVASRVAVDAARTQGRLAAAPAIVNLFQVCSTWRSVSRSDLLWQKITHLVWAPPHHHQRLLLPSTWHSEFRRLHRTALNFRIRRYSHSLLLPHLNPTTSCRRLALSDRHLAAGFSDGTVHLYLISPFTLLLATFGPHPHQPRLGLYAHSISGIGLLPNRNKFVFAFQDGDVHVASLDDLPNGQRRAHVGSPVETGLLVDFVCDSRWWIGLFAGVPGRSWQVWDGETEQVVYVGGTLTDPDSVMGWHMLTDSREDQPAVGRVRIPEPGIAVGCTASRMQVIRLDGEDMGRVVGQRVFGRGRKTVVDAVDGRDGKVMVVDERKVGRVCVARALDEVVCRFNIERERRIEEVVGCMNWGYGVVWCSASSASASASASSLLLGAEIRVWDIMTGEYLYTFRERVGDVSVMVANDRFVAAWGGATGLHAWDFGDHNEDEDHD